MADVNRQTEEMLSPDDMMLDSEPVTSEQLVEAGKDLGQFALESTPIVGEAIIAKDIGENISEGDYLSAGLNTAALGVGALPLVGDVLNRPLRAAAKNFSKADVSSAKKLMDDDAAATVWKKKNKLPESQRQKRVPEVQDAAKQLSEGKITSKEYRRIVKANQPIKPITLENFPEMPTKTDIVGALKATDPRKVDTGIIGVNKTIPDGTRVGSRLDIPSYDGYDKWIVSLHDGTKKGGESIGYGQSAVLKNVEFVSSAKGGLNIAKDKNKATIARIHGDYYNAEPENVFEAAKTLINDPEWTQIGMNPFRHSFFYDKATGNPVTRADEVIQVGPLVLAKGLKKPTISELKELKVKTSDGKTRMFNEGGMAIEKQTEPLFSKLFRPEFNLSGETTSKNIDFGELDNEPLKAELKQNKLSGRVGFTGTTENNTSYGLGANLSSNKGTIKTPKELREYGVPEKIEFGSGKLKGNSYDGFLALQDIFGVEGLEARIDAKYTPLEYEKDLKNIALNFKYEFNEGGMAIEKQMEMFEDGGLMQEGGTVDPVSGNDVPVGSTQEEVRDDIPAQLSEGEFVFPADVVRFYGLEKLMEMRQNAKAGLQRMEDMGQMGNSEEATLPDDIPFDLEDLDMEDEPEYNNTMEMQVGGFVQPQGFTGIQSTQPSQFQNYQPQYVPYQAPTVPTTYQPAQQQTVPTIPSGQLPQAEQFLQAPQPGEQDLRKYVNDEGQVRMIPFVNDQPVYPIPQGFYPEAEKPVEEETPTAVTTETARVREGGGRDDASTQGATMSFGGSINPETGLVDNAITANLSYSGIPGGFMGVGSAAAGILGFGDGVSLKENQTATIDSATMGNTTITFDADTFNSLNKNTVTSAERAEVKSIMETVGKVLGKSKYKNDLTFKEAKDIHDGYDRDLDMSVGYGKGQVDPSLAAAVAKSKGIDPSDKGLPDSGKSSKTSAPTSQGGGKEVGGPGQSSFGGGQTGKGSGPTAGGFGGTGVGRSDFNKGGNVTKKMKRGGLASKK